MGPADTSSVTVVSRDPGNFPKFPPVSRSSFPKIRAFYRIPPPEIITPARFHGYRSFRSPEIPPKILTTRGVFSYTPAPSNVTPPSRRFPVPGPNNPFAHPTSVSEFQ